MKILICTGIYPPDIGGPSYYAKCLAEELSARNNRVRVKAYAIEKYLPTGIRHVWYFFRILPAMYWCDRVVFLDTFSVAWPGVCAAKLFGKKSALRTGGDFLWEQYIERTKEKILLSEFYESNPALSLKERIIFRIIRFVFRNTDAIIFSTAFQRDIFLAPYDIPKEKTYIVENYIDVAGRKKEVPSEKVFIWAGRRIQFKNLDVLKEAFEIAKEQCPEVSLKILPAMSREELLGEIAQAYAVVYPSLTEISQNFILEAIMTGTPFVGTIDHGLPEIKDLGVFVDPRTPEGVAEGICELAREDVYTRKQEAIAAFSRHHDYGDIAKEFEQILAEC